MPKRDAGLPAIYEAMIQDASQRLNASTGYLASANRTRAIFDVEAAVLQLRKALEAIAFAAIAPNKAVYAAFRATATKSPDFTKDFQASTIFVALVKVNPDFYRPASAR